MADSTNEAKERFIHSWAEMGPQWGIPRGMAQTHALLMISEEPLSTDDVMKELGISRGGANTSLRALVDWGLVRRVFFKGDRKEYFHSEKDVWNMFCCIARERKKREIEPVIDTMQECLKLAGSDKSSLFFRGRVKDLLELVRMLDYVLGRIAKEQKNSIMPRILKLLG